MTKWRDLFTDRQLVALTTFSDLVAEARERIQRDAVAAGMPDYGAPLREGGAGADAYAEAVGVYLAFAVDRICHDFSNSLVLAGYSSNGQKGMNIIREAKRIAYDVGLSCR